MKANKQEVITFKADATMAAALKQVPNRSEFIRTAILHALDNVCPLCQGNGVLTPEQRKHWEEFAAHHRVVECRDCHELHLVCDNQKK